MAKPKYSCTEDGRPVCVTGHVIGELDYFYIINPIGGYGRDEVLCCEACIQRPENKSLKLRMIEAGATELGSRPSS